jgi:hypothetical protein
MRYFLGRVGKFLQKGINRKILPRGAEKRKSRSARRRIWVLVEILAFSGL